MGNKLGEGHAGVMTEKIRKTRGILQAQNICVISATVVVPVYFRTVWRGSISPIRQALKECSATWALTGMSFVGASVLEILTNRMLKEGLIATMTLIGINQVRNFDIFGDALKRTKEREANEGVARRDAEMLER